MSMTVTPVSGFEYSTSIREFPVDVSIRLDAPVLVSSRVDVCAALLTRVGSEEASFGYVRRALPIKRDFVELENAPLHFQLNIFEHDDDFRNFTPGEYRCDVKVEFYIKSEHAVRRIEHEDGFKISLV